MQFEWDHAKAKANERKHGVSFEEAASIFRGDCLHRLDERRDYGETRLIALGTDSNGVVLSVVYTIRSEAIRIISAWKASKHEREAYATTRAGDPL
jgi:uncharacterized DUF497 family protein